MINLANAQMVDKICELINIDEPIKKAFLSINREIFIDSSMRHQAYKLDALPITSKQWISSPLTVAKMTQLIYKQGLDCVLEIGCGSGYQAAILSKIFRRVFSIERIDNILSTTRSRIRSNGFLNINTKLGDGQAGWAQYAPYDAIIFSACIASIPQNIISQLKNGAFIVAPIKNKNGTQNITRFRKIGNSLKAEIFDACDFVPILDGVKR